MNKALSRRISIFLTVDSTTINDYFNPHDPAPIYKRQLRHDFVQYIRESVNTYKRDSTITYKISYKPEDHDLMEPFMHAVRRHFFIREQLKKVEFEKFKKLIPFGFIPLPVSTIPILSNYETSSSNR